MHPTIDANTIQIIAPLVAVQVILVISALIALARAEGTKGPKWAWALVILLGSMAGPIVFFIFGRRND